ncbi:hypothetical protein QR685DRAFT_514966 [Neurospora intermedia]|uniref:Uncharacterized protein n=1 Tax=Neurospora intermedia TaxID=5142 RepID=A0ABR3DJA8_NEUIN
MPFSLPSVVYLSTSFPMPVSSLVLGGLENPLRRQISVQHFATGTKVFFFFLNSTLFDDSFETRVQLRQQLSRLCPLHIYHALIFFSLFVLV